MIHFKTSNIPSVNSVLFSNCLACSLLVQYGVNMCETRLCGSLTGSAGLILNWSGWNIGNEKDWWALSRFELTDVWRLAGVIGLLYGWSFTSGQEMHSACFQWSQGDWLTNCSLLESFTLLIRKPEALEDKGTKRESYLVSLVPHDSTLTVIQI